GGRTAADQQGKAHGDRQHNGGTKEEQDDECHRARLTSPASPTARMSPPPGRRPAPSVLQRQRPVDEIPTDQSPGWSRNGAQPLRDYPARAIGAYRNAVE